MSAIEDGLERGRLAPQLTRLAGGVSGSDDLEGVRRHLRTCLSCRARVKALRIAVRGPGRGRRSGFREAA